MGSSGTLIGSTLESLGYYYQDWILDALGGPFQYQVGMLVFLLGVASVIFLGVFKGEYKYATYMLFGPGVFFSMVCIREYVPPAEWKFAGYGKIANAVETETAQALVSQPRLWKHVGGGSSLRDGDSIPEAKVSSVFAWYNSLVSNILQQISFVILRERATLPEKLFNRAELITATQSTKIVDPGLRDLLHVVMMNGCREAFDYAQKAYEAGAMTSMGSMNIAKMQDILDTKQVSLTREAQNYVAQMYVDYGPSSPSSKASGGDVFSKLLKINVLPSYSSDPLSEVKALKQVIQSIDSDLAKKDHRSQEEIAATKDTFRRQNQSYTCSQVWALTYFGIYSVAEQAVKRGQSKAIDSRFSAESFICDLKKVVAPHEPDATVDAMCKDANDSPASKPIYFEDGDPLARAAQPWLLYGAVAKYILRNELSDTGSAHTSFIKTMQGREKAYHSVEDSEEMDPMLAERIDQEKLEWRYPTEIDAIASSMPYYQGLILCFLGITFPFFSVALLIPGKHVLFVKWFQMWLWAKSWDVGFAVVMLMEQVLFNIFSVTRYQGASAPSAELNPDMVLAIGALHEIDPSFDMGTYGWIIKTCIVAVPLVLSQIILGAVGAGASLIDGTVQGYASHFGMGAFKAGGMSEMGKYRTSFVNYSAGHALKEAQFAMSNGGSSPDPYNGAYQSQLRQSQIGTTPPVHNFNYSANKMSDMAVAGTNQKEWASFANGLVKKLNADGKMSNFWADKLANAVVVYGVYQSDINKEAAQKRLAQAVTRGEWRAANSTPAQVYSVLNAMNESIPIPFQTGTMFDADTAMVKFDGTDQEIEKSKSWVDAFEKMFASKTPEEDGEEEGPIDKILLNDGTAFLTKLFGAGFLATHLGESIDGIEPQGAPQPDSTLSNAVNEAVQTPRSDDAPDDSPEYSAKLDNLKKRMVGQYEQDSADAVDNEILSPWRLRNPSTNVGEPEDEEITEP